VGVIELLWTNVHGAFPLGVVLPGIFCAGVLLENWSRGWRAAICDRQFRTYLSCLAVAGLLMFVNPQGLDTFTYVGGVTSKATERGLEEWLPTNVQTTTGQAFYASLLVVIVAAAWNRFRLSPTEWILLVAFGCLSLTSLRMVVWWALAAATAIARPAAASVAQHRRPAERPDRIAAAVVTAMLVVAVFSTPWTRIYNPVLPLHKRIVVMHGEPAGAVQFLQQNDLSGRLYHPMEWGSYLSCALHPKVKVFIDSRVDFFPDTVWQDYLCIGTDPSRAEALLDRYKVDLVAWDRHRLGGLTNTLKQSPRWTCAFEDEMCVVFKRTDGTAGNT
jgi:hypothetical protein